MCHSQVQHASLIYSKDNYTNYAVIPFQVLLHPHAEWRFLFYVTLNVHTEGTLSLHSLKEIISK